jgi:hypothetical protein
MTPFEGKGGGVITFVVLVALLVGFVARGRDREAYYRAEETCSKIRFSATADAARIHAARSGGTVTATPRGFTLRFERNYYSNAVGCVVEIEGDRVAKADFERFKD